MILKAITYNYTEDGVPFSKVVGIFKEEQLEDALKTIKKIFSKDGEVIEDKCEESSKNYFIKFNDVRDTYFYTSDYKIGELNI